MTLTKQQVREVLEVYIRAWEGQDPDLIGTIFTEGWTSPSIKVGTGGTGECLRVLTGRATSVPFTAVLNGPERTTAKHP
jgi:hypothetical protein